MQQEVHCITLRLVKHSDTTSIATLWTRELGRLTVAVPLGKGKESQRRRALMMPLSVFEAVASVKPGQEMARLSGLRPIAEAAVPHPAASVIAMFLADFLYSALRESEGDPNLADFLFEGARELQRSYGMALANFHLWFLYHLGHFLGIEPDTRTYSPDRYFDMREARFTATPPMHANALGPDEGRVVYLLSRLRPRTLSLLRLSREQRNAILDGILDYYSLHYAPMTNLRSLSVVREIFS